ncbi:MAG TPA: MFS transporter [Devosiaceae bacterium]|nr:MFS transporter [Devosiaceae bacterium]
MTTTSPPRHSVAGVVTAASFGFSVVQLDVTIVNVALPAIEHSLGAGIAELQWVIDAYALVFAVLLLSAGVIGDRFGSRQAYLAGFWLFAASSLACGLAPNAATLIAARATQGIGAALLVPSSLTLINHACGHDAALRARMVGVWTATSGIAIASGPIVGGLLLGWFGWRTIFLVNIPVCLFAITLTLKVTQKSEVERQDGGLDPFGQVLAIAALTGLVGAVIEARPLGLTSPVVIGGAVIAVLAGVGFVGWEHRSKAPMLPLKYFGLPNFSAATLFGAAVNLTYYGALFVLSLYLQQAKGWTPIQAGLAYLPLTGTFILSNTASGMLAARFGSQPPMVAGAMIAAIGFGLLVPLGVDSSFLDMLPAFVLIPAGMGLAVPAMTTAILSSVEREASGVASAVLNTARQAAGAIGVALFGALAGTGAEIVPGLRSAALISVALALCAAALAALGMTRTRQATVTQEDRAAA